MSTIVIVGIVIALVAVAVLAWYFWPDSSTPPKSTVDKAKDAAQAGDTAGYQQSLADAVTEAEAQRATDPTIDPGLLGLRIIDRASMAPINTKWEDFRSINVADPVKRTNTYDNLQGMIGSAADLTASMIPHIYTAAGMDYARNLTDQLGAVYLTQRDCWFRRDHNGCWRDWSVGEPSENDRVTLAQQSFNNLYIRMIPLMESRASELGLPQPWPPSDVEKIRQALLADPVINVDNPVDAATFAQIQAAAALYAPDRTKTIAIAAARRKAPIMLLGNP